MRVSFIGLGAMGYPIAGHLSRAGHQVGVWNRTESQSRRHADEYGTRVLDDLHAAGDAELVFSCLPTSREVDEVITRIGSLTAPLWVDLTSGDPDAARATARALGERGICFLDSPVSGGLGGARAGTLTVMVGGDGGGLERARPAIVSFAHKVVHMGDSGSGCAMKAVNNSMLAIQIRAAAEGLHALTARGIDAARALEVLNASSGRSHVTEKLLPGVIASGEYPVTFKLALLTKDTRIGSGLMSPPGVATLTSVALSALDRAVLERGAEVDYLELFLAK